MVSHIEVCLPENLPTPNNIGEGFKGPQRQFLKESLFVQYDQNKNFNLILAPIPIKYLPEGKTFIHLIIAPIIKEGDCYYEWKFVSCHIANGSSHIQDIGLISPTFQWHMLTPSE